MIGRRGKFFLEAIGLSIAGLIALCFALIFAVTHGPVHADFLLPAIRSIAMREAGVAINADHIDLGGGGWGKPLSVVLEGGQVEVPSRGLTLSLPRTTAVLSWRGVLRGGVSIESLSVTEPHVVLRSQQSTAGTESEHDGGRLLPQEVTVTDGTVDIENQAGGILAGYTGIEIALSRGQDGVGGHVDAVQTLAGTTTTLHGELAPGGGKGDSDLVLHAAALPLAALAPLSPQLAFAAGWNVSVSSEVKAVLHDLTLRRAEARLTIGAGNIVDAEHLDLPVIVAGGHLTVAYQAEPKTLRVSDLLIDLGGPQISGMAEAVEPSGGAISVQGQIAIANMPVNRFNEYWPKGVAAGGRHWVLASLSDGIVPRATLAIVATAPADDPSSLTVSDAHGVMSPKGLTVRYFGELTPARDTSADIDYDMHGMRVHLTGGHADDLRITDGLVDMEGFDRPDQDIAIDVTLAGPIQTALHILDQPPLKYGSKLGMSAQSITGSAETKLHLAMPMKADVAIDSVDLLAQSALTGLSMPHVLGKADLSAFDGTLRVDQKGLLLNGHGTLGKAKSEVNWQQSFDSHAHPGIDATISSVLDEPTRQLLGLAAPDRLTGDVPVKAHYLKDGDSGTADITIDLTPALLRIDEVAYNKPEGTPGKAQFTVELQGGGVTRLRNISVQAEHLDAHGEATLDPDSGALKQLRLEPFHVDGTDAAIVVDTVPGGGSKIGIAGAAFDARPLLHKRRTRDRSASSSGDNSPPLTIDVDVHRVITSESNGLDDLHGSLKLSGGRWASADFTASADGGAIFLSYDPDPAPASGFTLRAGAADLGAALAGFSLTQSVHGGVLTVDGHKEGTLQDSNRPLNGHVKVEEFRVTDVPALARLFDLLSLRGFQETVAGDGIRFSGFNSDFTVDDTTLRIGKARLVGPSIGLTIDGTADRNAGTLDLSGTAVPAYSVNRMLNRIPVIGPVLTGGEGEGVFAATYTVTGTFEKPDVSVNPLSIFAPGVLRDLLFKGKPDEVPSEGEALATPVPEAAPQPQAQPGPP